MTHPRLLVSLSLAATALVSGPRLAGQPVLSLLPSVLSTSVLAPSVQPGGDSIRSTTEDRPLDYFIVVTGGEVLEGAYPDGHTHFLTRTLRLVGGRCVGSLTVNDQRDEMLRALRFATNQAPLVLVTGGLGPTPNDITRETLSEFTGIPLREHPEALADLERRFGQTREALRPNLRRQTLVPERGGYLKNGSGTAVGLIFDLAGPVGEGRGVGSGALIVALPGPPRELQPMALQELAPYLQKRCGARAFGHSLTLRFVGVGQSQIDQTIKDHVALEPDVIVTSAFEGSRVDFTFALPGHRPEDLARLQRLEAGIREHLGDFVYADDGASLEEVVARRFLAREASVVVVEVGSGGQLAAALGGLRDASRFFAGACSASTEETLAELLDVPPTKRGVTGRERAEALAEAAARWGGNRWALAVGRVEEGPGGQRTVWMALKSDDGRCATYAVPARDGDQISRTGLVTAILDRLRRWL